MDSYQEHHAIETYKSLIVVSIEALRTLLLLNGGALVALGTLVGSRTIPAPRLLCSSLFFVGGLVAAGVAFFGSYAVQLTLYNEAMGTLAQGRHGWVLWATIAIGLFSLTLFGLGAVAAIVALATLA